MLEKTGRYVFPLCRTCAELDVLEPDCLHSELDRAITGTYATCEIELALRKGYQCLSLYEVWHFSQRSSELFAPFLREFASEKIRSSGLPRETKGMSLQEKIDFIEDLCAKNGVHLELEDFSWNPSKRQTFKIWLNSFWGR